MAQGWVDLPIRALPSVSVYSLLPPAGQQTGVVYAVILDEAPNPSGMYYSDGTTWIMVTDSSGAGVITGGLNLGSGAQVFKDVSGSLMRFRSLVGVNMTVVEGANEITLTPTFANSASPGYSYSIAGPQTAGTWLHAGEQASNLAGWPVPFTNPTVTSIAIRTGATDTLQLGLYEHDGTTYTLLHTTTVTAARAFDESGLSIAVTTGKELAVRVLTGSLGDGAVVALTLQGEVV